MCAVAQINSHEARCLSSELKHQTNRMPQLVGASIESLMQRFQEARVGGVEGVAGEANWRTGWIKGRFWIFEHRQHSVGAERNRVSAVQVLLAAWAIGRRIWIRGR